MNEEYIFFDMDGTIVSFHDRFYKIYRDAYFAIGEIPLSKEEWINQRKFGEIKYPYGVREKLNPFFEKYFECTEYLLKYDKLFPGMKNVINSLQKKYPIKIVSFRANSITLNEQLKYLGINNVEIIIKGFSHDILAHEKANMIKNVIPDPKGWIIGDCHYEILAGQKLGLKTIAVTWGDQSRETLEKYEPDFLVDKPKDILKIVN